MKNIILILLTIPLLFGSCKKNRLRRNTWSKTFGGSNNDLGNSVQQITDGGYIICGSTLSFGNGDFDVYLIKTDENGEEEWNKTYGGTEDDRGRSVQQTNDGGYIICGSTKSFGNGSNDVYLIKTDHSGNELWTKTFGGTNLDQGNQVQQTNDGGYIICGSTLSSGNRGWEVYLIKTDGNGDSLWTKTFGGIGIEFGKSVHQTTNGGYIISCTTTSFGSGLSDLYLIKTDGNGDSLWTKTFGGPLTDVGKEIQLTTDGGYIITGYKHYYVNGNNVETDFYLLKTDLNGIEEWSKTYDGSSWDLGGSVHQTNDGGYIILGSLDSPIYDLYLIKTDLNGNEEWNKTYGGTEYDRGRSVQQTNDGGYIICGSTESFGNGSTDVYLIKTDENGDYIP